MNQPIQIDTGLRELDRRESDGLEVTLLWSAGRDDVVVEVVDTRLGTAFAVHAERRRALDAFRHPFAYAVQAGVDLGVWDRARQAVCA